MSEIETTNGVSWPELRGPNAIEVLPLHEPQIDWHRVHNLVNSHIERHEWFVDDLFTRINFDELFPELYVKAPFCSHAVYRRAHVCERHAREVRRTLIQRLQNLGWICREAEHTEYLLILHPQSKKIGWWERLWARVTT